MILKLLGYGLIILIGYSLYVTKYFQSKLERIVRRILIIIPFTFPILGISLDLLSIYLTSLKTEVYGCFPICLFYGIIACIATSPIVIINLIQGLKAKKLKIDFRNR